MDALIDIKPRLESAMRTSLIISTYNKPDFLALVLLSLMRQKVFPDEVVIANDGSGPDTSALIAKYEKRADFPIMDVWQQDSGFRKCRILNQSIASCTGDFIVIIDGDMILHRSFIEDHIAFAQPGRYTQGRRISLRRRMSQRALLDQRTTFSFFTPGLNRRPQAIRSRWLARRVSKENKSLHNSRGCNQAFWKSDLIAVNGFNEDFEGWGMEDTELVQRLHQKNISRIYLRHAALAYHLWHEELPRDQVGRNARLLEAGVEGNGWCDQGIDQYLTSIQESDSNCK